MGIFKSILNAFDNNYLLLYLFIIIMLLIIVNVVNYFTCPKINQNVIEEKIK
jgi:hypothetical protein